MCTYTFQQIVCPCAKGECCPQGISRGMARVDGNLHHFRNTYWAVESLGSACDYQRRIGCQATLRCPRYAFDPKRVINGSYHFSDLACIKCVVSCAPPSVKHQAPGPNGPFEGGEMEAAASAAAAATAAGMNQAGQGAFAGAGGGVVGMRAQGGYAAGYAAGYKAAN